MASPAKTKQAVGSTGAESGDHHPKTGARQSRPAEDQARLATAARNSAMELLLALDQKTREVKSETELWHLMINETRELTGARQIFYLQKIANEKFRVRAVSSIGVLDRDAPLVRWVERLVATMFKAAEITKQCAFDITAHADPKDETTESYPFGVMLWQPLQDADGSVYGGLLLARERAFNEREQALARRQAGVYAHAQRALSAKRRIKFPSGLRRWLWAAAAVSMILIGFAPVPLTTLAPIEVVARDPFIVASPIDGVIDEIHPLPNRPVKAGDLLVQFDDTTLRNRLELAEREMRVAEAQYRRAIQGAFSDDDARRNLAITRAEYALKRADRLFAAELLRKTKLHAPRSGLLIYSNRDQWKGRPVRTGERIMIIANEKKTSLAIELPVNDAIVLNENARVKVFLDTDPLNTLEARLVEAGYQAETSATDQLVFRIRARLAESEETPRIGARGTAQIFGEDVPLAFFLFRRPIAAARQFLGL